MSWLQRRKSGVYRVRRVIPPRLRPFFGGRTIITRVLGTCDPQTAKRKALPVVADIDRQFAEAEAAIKNPAVLEYRTLQEDLAERTERPRSDEEEDAINAYLITKLEEDERGEARLDPTERLRFLALLKRRDEDAGDNPPLSILFERYYAERKLPPKTKLEWEGVRRRFIETLGGDLPVQAITPAHVRSFKTALLASPSNRQPVHSGKDESVPALRTLSPATVQKNLNALRSVLSWGKREGYLTVNPADGITQVSAQRDPDEGRLPYDAADLKRLFSRDACAARKARPADYWLPFLALFTGARLEELGQLLVTDVRQEEGADYLAIEPGDGKRLKTRSSRRSIPVHPKLIRLGFLAFAEDQRKAGQERLFPELRATRYGSLTAVWSKYWGRHARELGLTDPRKTFHSFRHGFKDACRRAGISEEHHDALTGHSNGSVGRSYGRGVALKKLAESMKKVSYPGLDLSHLQGDPR